MIESIISKYPSKSAFCDAVGISKQFFWQIENRKRRWPAAVVVKLNKLHGVDPSELRPDIWPPDEKNERGDKETS